MSSSRRGARAHATKARTTPDCRVLVNYFHMVGPLEGIGGSRAVEGFGSQRATSRRSLLLRFTHPGVGTGVDTFEVVVAVSPVGGADLLEHDLRVLKPALLYADRVRLLSTSAWFAFGTAAEFAADDLPTRARVLAAMIDGMGGSPGAAALRQHADFAESLEVGNRDERRAAAKKLGKQGRSFVREFTKRVDEQWETTREALYEAIDRGGSASQLADAAERGVLDFDPLGYDEGADFAEGLLASWVDKVDEALLDPAQFVLFDEQVAGLVQSKLNEDLLDLHELSRAHSRQVGLASGFLSRLPTLDRASAAEILDFRDDVEQEVAAYIDATSELSDRAQGAELHRSDFQAYVEHYWQIDVQPALKEIAAKARRARLMSHSMDELAEHGPSAGILLGTLLGAALATSLPEVVLGATAGGATAGAAGRSAWRVHRRHQAEQDELRGYRYVLIHRVQQDLAG